MSDKKTIYYTTEIYTNTQQDFRGHSLCQHQFFRKQKYTTFLSNYTQYYSSYYRIAESVNDTGTVWLQLLTLHVMAPGWILVSKSLEQPLQSRLRYNLPAQEAVSSCHIAVTLWSWGKNPWHDLWALLTTPHLPETQNCCLLPGMRGPSSQHHSGTPRAEQPRQQPRHPTTTSTAAAIRAADGPEGARGVQSLLCLQQEGRPWKESIAALSVPWNPSHCCLMPWLKPGSLEARLYVYVHIEGIQCHQCP